MTAARRVCIVAGVVLLLFSGLEARYARGARQLFTPPRRPLDPSEARLAHESLPGLEDVSFRSRDGLLLRGYYVPSANGASVVLTHGLGQNRLQLLPEAELLSRHGYGVLLFDWRDHGESEGDCSTWGDREQGDLESAIDFVAKRPDVTGGRIGALGFSIGASALTQVAAVDDRVRAVVLEAVFTSFEDQMRMDMGARGPLSLWPTFLVARWEGIRPERVRNTDRIAAIAPRPILFVTGTLDPNTPVDVVRRVYDAAGTPKRLVTLRAAHGGYAEAEPEAYERALTGFLDAALLR